MNAAISKITLNYRSEDNTVAKLSHCRQAQLKFIMAVVVYSQLYFLLCYSESKCYMELKH